MVGCLEAPLPKEPGLFRVVAGRRKDDPTEAAGSSLVTWAICVFGRPLAEGAVEKNMMFVNILICVLLF